MLKVIYGIQFGKSLANGNSLLMKLNFHVPLSKSLFIVIDCVGAYDAMISTKKNVFIVVFFVVS